MEEYGKEVIQKIKSLTGDERELRNALAEVAVQLLGEARVPWFVLGPTEAEHVLNSHLEEGGVVMSSEDKQKVLGETFERMYDWADMAIEEHELIDTFIEVISDQKIGIEEQEPAPQPIETRYGVVPPATTPGISGMGL